MGRLARKLAWAALWLVAVLLFAEGAVRGLAWFLRRDAIPAAARSGAGVVYCIGDSFTYGQGVKPEEAWPQVLGRMLRDADPERAPRMQTLAEPGRSSSVAVQDAKSALEAGDARMLLVLTGWNANDGDFAAHAAERRQSVPWTTTLDIWLQHSRLYRVAKQALTVRDRTLVFDDVKLVPQTTAMSLYDFRAYQEIAQKNLRQIARMCRASGVPCVFLTYPHQVLPPQASSRTEYYHSLFGRTPLAETDYLLHDRRPGEIAIDAVIREVAGSEGIPWIDLQPPFDADPKGLFQADYHHPTAAGHELIAEAVFQALQGRQKPLDSAPAPR